MQQRERRAVKTGTFVVVTLMLALQAVPAGQSAPPAAGTPQGRRHTIRMMEAVLSQAVRGGAEHLAEQLGSGNPNVSFFTGQARARGFMLEGYGVFFHVEIPEMQGSLVMSVTTLERDLAVSGTLESLRRAVDSFPDGASKMQAEDALKRLQVQIAPLPQLTPQASGPSASQSVSQPASGVIRAATDAPVVDPVPAVPLPSLRDPKAAYRDAIKSALIDAMLDYSRGMNIQPDEWLSVAANRGDTAMPDEIVTSTTLVLRIKGSDLAIYESDRSQKDEIRKRVEVREF